MAIGRDMYVDTRMILQRLEELFPASAEHPGLSSKETAGVAALLNKFVADASVFSYAAAIMPLEAPALKSSKFMKDREAFSGRPWTIDHVRAARPEALVHVRQSFDIAESLFADGRQWVAGTKGPSFADLEGNDCVDRTREYFMLTISRRVDLRLDDLRSVSAERVHLGRHISEGV